MLSTNKLAAYFVIRILPTMESRVSTPQPGYFPAPVPELMVYVDYRFLHLYLTGHKHGEAVSQYHKVSYDNQKQHNMIIEDAERYLKLFQEEKVAFDYSRFYQESMLENKQCYSTVSHPNNKHLSVF